MVITVLVPLVCNFESRRDCLNSGLGGRLNPRETNVAYGTEGREVLPRIWKIWTKLKLLCL